MEAGKRTLDHIFNAGRSLEVPFYQRSYVWDETNWERFLDDMVLVSTIKKNHFMGSLILKAKEVGTDRRIGDVRSIVDGQQRLTTIILFFKALAMIRKDDSLQMFFNRNKEIILRHNHNDISAFEDVLKLDAPIIRKEATSRIQQCLNYFFDKAEVLSTIDPIQILNHLYFVGIDLGVDEDEQQIFDTINSLGVSLTTGELLKNELFKRDDVGLYERTWKETFEKDEETKDYWDRAITSGRQHRTNIDLFLQAFLLIQLEGKIESVNVESLFNSFKGYLKSSGNDRSHLIEKLMRYAALYRENFDPAMLDDDIQRSGIQRLNIIIFGLNTTTVVPYVLHVLSGVDDRKEREKLFSLLETYIMRRLVCRDTSKNYNRFFASLIKGRIETYDALLEKFQHADDQVNRLPADDQLRDGFQKSNLTNDQAKTVLYLLEKSCRPDHMQTDLKGFNSYSLEHLMPKKWINNWDKPATEEACKVRDQILLKLGNLTLLTHSLNTAIRDASWQLKKDGKNTLKGLKTYGAGITILESFLEREAWNESIIQERGEFLFKNALGVWQV